MEYVLVFILAFLAGGWAVTAGVLLDLNPIGVWIPASLRSLTFLAIALTAGGWLRDLLVRRLGGEDAEASVRERAGPMVERWGTAGFGLIGPVVIGPSLSILGALVIGSTGASSPRCLRSARSSGSACLPSQSTCCADEPRHPPSQAPGPIQAVMEDPGS